MIWYWINIQKIQNNGIDVGIAIADIRKIPFFEELNVKKELVQGLKEMGLKEPTEIQTKAIPLIKQGKEKIWEK